MAVVKKISELVPKGSALGVTDLLVVGVDNGTDYDLKSVTGAQLMSGSVSQTITDGDTTHSPSSNVVFDALALKVDKELGHRLITSGEATILDNTSGTNSGDETVTTIKTKLGITTLSGSNTGDETNASITTLVNNATASGAPTDTDKLPITNIGGTMKGLSWSLLKSTLNALFLSSADTFYAKMSNNLSDLTNTTTARTNLGLGSLATQSGTFSGTSSGTNTGDQDLSGLVVKNTAITGATKTKITYDSKGLVTSGTDATTSDISDSLNKRYVTDANLTVIGNTSGTNTGDQDLSTYQPYTTATTGSVISFIVPQIYNTVASPSSSNITDSLTSAKIGIVQKIYHNHTVAPTFPAGWVKMGTATYTTSTLNVIFAEWVSSTRVEYWITKPS